MLNYQTAHKLREMKLHAMSEEYLRQQSSPDMAALDFDERLGMLADAEWLSRENRRIRRLQREANLRFGGACFADIDYHPTRKLDRASIARLTDFAWAKQARNLIITGATGTGKTWLACAFGAEACRVSIRTRFYRVGRLFGELALAQVAGSFSKTLTQLSKADILILDDWGLASISAQESRMLLEVVDERYGRSSTIISAQAPVSEWHGLFEDSTIADAVLDRLVHSAYRFELKGPSKRASPESAAPAGQQDTSQG